MFYSPTFAILVVQMWENEPSRTLASLNPSNIGASAAPKRRAHP